MRKFLTIFRICPKSMTVIRKTNKRFLTFSENYRSLPKASEEDTKIFRQ